MIPTIATANSVQPKVEPQYLPQTIPIPAAVQPPITMASSNPFMVSGMKYFERYTDRKSSHIDRKSNFYLAPVGIANPAFTMNEYYPIHLTPSGQSSKDGLVRGSRSNPVQVRGSLLKVIQQSPHLITSPSQENIQWWKLTKRHKQWTGNRISDWIFKFPIFRFYSIDSL